MIFVDEIMFQIFKFHGYPRAKTTNNQGEVVQANNEKPKILQNPFYTKLAKIVALTLA